MFVCKKRTGLDAMGQLSLGAAAHWHPMPNLALLRVATFQGHGHRLAAGWFGVCLFGALDFKVKKNSGTAK